MAIYDKFGYLTPESASLMGAIRESVLPILRDAVDNGLAIEEMGYLAYRSVGDLVIDFELDRLC